MPTSITLLCLLWQKRLSALLVLSSRVQCWNVTIIILQPSLNIFVFWLSVRLLLSTNCQNNTFALFLFLAHYELIAMRWIAVIIMCQPFATIWKKPYVLAKFMPWHHKKNIWAPENCFTTVIGPPPYYLPFWKGFSLLLRAKCLWGIRSHPGLQNNHIPKIRNFLSSSG